MHQPESSTLWRALADAYKVWRIFRRVGIGRGRAWFFAGLMYKAHVWVWHGQSQVPRALQQKDALTRALMRLEELAQEGKSPQ